MSTEASTMSPLPSATLGAGLTADPAPERIERVQLLEDPAESAGAGMSEGEMRRELAWSAKPFSWQGKELQPFAIDREGDWLVHRALIGAAPLSAIVREPAAFLLDACRILWFCSHDPREWLESPLQKLPAFAGEKRLTEEERALKLEGMIRAWARENIPPGEQTDAVNLAYEIYNRAHENRAVPRPDQEKKGASLGES